MLSFFLLGILSGAIADRWERRSLVRASALGASAITLVMALLLAGPARGYRILVKHSASRLYETISTQIAPTRYRTRLDWQE